MIPSIEIFVRHSAGCRYRDDETWKRCGCRKHLRWTFDGKQYRRSAKTRAWTQAGGPASESLQGRKPRVGEALAARGADLWGFGDRRGRGEWR